MLKSQLKKLFCKLSEEINANIGVSDFDSKLLFHYTKLASAIKIIESNKLYFSEYCKLDDRVEFSFARDIVIEIIKDQLSRSLSKMQRAYLEKALIDFDKFCQEKQLFVFSLCEDSDNEKLWEDYGDKHEGVALGFQVKRNNCCDFNDENTWPHVLLKVKYGKGLCLEDLRQYVSSYANVLKCLKRESEYIKIASVFIGTIYPELPRYKDCCWSSQVESRMYVVDAPDKRIHSNLIKNDKFVSNGIVKKELAEVCIGKSSLIKEGEIEALLSKENYDVSSITVKKMK